MSKPCARLTVAVLAASLVFSSSAGAAAVGARFENADAAKHKAKKKRARPLRPGPYKGKTTSSDPNESNLVVFDVVKSGHGLALGYISLNLVLTCEDGVRHDVTVAGYPPNRISIPAKLNRAFSGTVKTHANSSSSYGASGTITINGKFTAPTSGSGTINFTIKRQSDGKSCTSGTRPYLLHKVRTGK